LLNRDDSPWYPTVRLFRQSETREYGSVIERVRTELPAAVAQHARSISGANDSVTGSGATVSVGAAAL